jgi:hypothetical protein
MTLALTSQFAGDLGGQAGSNQLEFQSEYGGVIEDLKSSVVQSS